MKIGQLDTDKQVIVIAEIGNNHEGNYALAEQMIVRAKESGADIVKFQTIVPERLVSPLQTERVQQLKRFQFTYEQFHNLKKTADNVGIVFMSTPFDLESATALNEFVPAFKIASGDNTFYPLLHHVATFQKPIILSTGLTNNEEVQKAVSTIESAWAKVNESASTTPEIALLHCVVSYPAPVHEANLRAIRSLEKFGYTVGYSDHTIGIDTCCTAVASGARIVEKHFTVDKNYSAFRDHQLSADPQDMSEMVQRIRELDPVLGNGIKESQTSEEANRIAVRRSIIAKVALTKGHILRNEDLTWVRPGTGLAPGSEASIVGKTLLSDIEQGGLITLDSVGE